jgi:hypothetical protein
MIEQIWAKPHPAVKPFGLTDDVSRVVLLSFFACASSSFFACAIAAASEAASTAFLRLYERGVYQSYACVCVCVCACGYLSSKASFSFSAAVGIVLKI